MKLRVGSIVLFVLLLANFAISQTQQWPVVNADGGRSSWASLENELHPPLQRGESYSLKRSGGDAEVLTAYNDLLCVSTSGTPNTIEAFDMQTGDTLWTFQVPESVGGCDCAAAQNDSLVFLGGQHGLGLYVLYRHTGQQKWFRPCGSMYTRHVMLDEQRAYFVADSLLCVDISDGSTVWAQAFSRQVTPALDESTVYVCGNDQALAFNKLTGDIIWQQYNEGQNFTAFAVDDLHFYTNPHDSVVARDKANGEIEWAYRIPDGQLSRLSQNAMAVSDSVLCFVCWQNAAGLGMIYGVDKLTGNEIWNHTFSSGGVFAPAIANGVVYVTAGEYEELYGFDVRTGEMIFHNNDRAYITQPIVYNHKLYVCSENKVIVFKNVDSEVAAEVLRPTNFTLAQNYPNPFNPTTTIGYDVKVQGRVVLKVYDLNGREIITLMDEEKQPGYYNVLFDGTNLSSGVYIYKIFSNNRLLSNKLVLLK